MKKFLALVMAAMMLLGMCSFASAEDEKIHLIFQYSFEEQMRPPIHAAVDQFMIDNPNVEVECFFGGAYTESNTRLLAAHAAALQGDMSGYPAIQQTECVQLPTFAANGVITPLNDLIEKFNFPIEDYFSGMVDAYSYDGKIYAIPAVASLCPTMYYNKTLAEELNAPFPKTWDEMEAWLEKVTLKDEQGNTIRYGMALAGWDQNYYAPFFYENGVEPFLDEECTQVGFASEAAIKTTQMLKDWVDKGYVKWYNGANASTNMRQSLIDGASMCVSHTCAVFSVYQPALEANGWELGIAFPPSGVKSQAQLAGAGFTIPSQLSDKEKEVAFQLIAAMTSPEANMAMVATTGYLPTSNQSLATEACKTWVETYPELQNIYDHLQSIQGPPQHPLWKQLTDKWEDALTLIFNDGADLESTLEEAVEECNEMLEEYDD